MNRIPKNALLALLVLLIVTVWLVSGMFGPPEKAQQETTAKKLPDVKVETFPPQPHVRKLELVARSTPQTQVNVAAQTEGDIRTRRVERGDMVDKGDVLLRINPAARQSALQAAQAEVKAVAARLESARNLQAEGLASATQVAELEAQLANAKRTVADVQQDIEYTTVAAPFKARVEDRYVDAGDFVRVGDPLFSLVSQDTYLITGFAAQAEVGRVRQGVQATARLANGQEVTGTITFVASQADPQTKTYRVDLEVDGSQHKIPTGMSATLEVPTPAQTAYKVPHAALVLSDEGELGVKTIARTSEQPIARFMPANILTDSEEAAWIEVQADKPLEIVTRGQVTLADGTPVRIQNQQEAIEE